MEKDKKQDILIRICCVIASLILWIYIRNVENPVTSHVIKYVPVEIQNVETLEEHGLVVVDDQDYSIDITVKGASQAVYQIDKMKDFKIVSDLSKYALKVGENRIPVEIKESPSGVTIVSNESMWIKVKIDKLKEKEMEIKPEIIGTLPEGYHVDGTTISVANVKVHGSEKLVDQVANVVARIDVTGSQNDINKNVDLIAVNEDGNAVEGVNLSVTSVTAKVDLKKGKVVPIQVQTTGNVLKGTLQGIEVEPNKVEILGKDSDVGKIEAIYTETIDLSQIVQDTTLTVKLVNPSNLKLSVASVNVKINVLQEKKIEKTIKVPIKHINALEGATIKMDAETVSVTVTGDESLIKTIADNSITATIDLKGLNDGDHVVKILISGVPEGVTISSQSADSVKVNIKKKVEENNTDVDKNQ